MLAVQRPSGTGHERGYSTSLGAGRHDYELKNVISGSTQVIRQETILTYPTSALKRETITIYVWDVTRNLYCSFMMVLMLAEGEVYEAK